MRTPEGWRRARLGEISEILIGGTPARNNLAYWDSDKLGQNRWAAISDLKGRFLSNTAEYITDLGVQKSNVKLIPRGTPVMSFKLSIGRTALTEIALYTNEAIAAFLPRESFDPVFLAYALPLAVDQGAEADQAVKGKTLNKAKLNELSLVLPPLLEQKKIAAILSSVDEAIEATQVVVEQLQVIKKAMMGELLTRGIPGRHSRFKKTEIGEVPEGWGVVRLDEVASIERGKFSHRPRNDPRFYGGQYPFIQTGDVAASGGRIRRYSQTLNDDGLRVSRMFPAGTIVITIAANIGDTGIAMMPVAFPDSLVGIQAGDDVDNRFLELVLRTRKEGLDKAAPQNAQKNINLETLRPLLIQVPSKEEQEEIAEVFESVDVRLIRETEYLEALRETKAALLSVLLTGEMRVGDNAGLEYAKTEP